jgi:hypothetical protein
MSVVAGKRPSVPSLATRLRNAVGYETPWLEDKCQIAPSNQRYFAWSWGMTKNHSG